MGGWKGAALPSGAGANAYLVVGQAGSYDFALAEYIAQYYSQTLPDFQSHCELVLCSDWEEEIRPELVGKYPGNHVVDLLVVGQCGTCYVDVNVWKTFLEERYGTLPEPEPGYLDACTEENVKIAVEREEEKEILEGAITSLVEEEFIGQMVESFSKDVSVSGFKVEMERRAHLAICFAAQDTMLEMISTAVARVERDERVKSAHETAVGVAPTLPLAELLKVIDDVTSLARVSAQDWEERHPEAVNAVEEEEEVIRAAGEAGREARREAVVTLAKEENPLSFLTPYTPPTSSPSPGSPRFPEGVSPAESESEGTSSPVDEDVVVEPEESDGEVVVVELSEEEEKLAKEIKHVKILRRSVACLQELCEMSQNPPISFPSLPTTLGGADGDLEAGNATVEEEEDIYEYSDGEEEATLAPEKNPVLLSFLEILHKWGPLPPLEEPAASLVKGVYGRKFRALQVVCPALGMWPEVKKKAPRKGSVKRR